MKRLKWTLGLGAAPTVLVSEDGRVSVGALLGLPGDPAFRSPETEGIFQLVSTTAPQGHGLRLKSVTKVEGVLRLTLASEDGLELVSEWESDSATGVLRRRDRVRNRSGKTVTVLKAMPRFTLARGAYRTYAQAGAWGKESQGAWQDLGLGSSLEWGSARGRLSVPAAPYLGVTPRQGGAGFALHIKTVGNWVIRLSSTDTSFWPGGPHAVLEAGLGDRNLALPLKSALSGSIARAWSSFVRRAIRMAWPAVIRPSRNSFFASGTSCRSLRRS